MPTVFIWRGLRFFFYSNERSEPPHIHVGGRGCEAKIWLSNFAVARNRGFSDRELRDIIGITTENLKLLSDAWETHLGS